MLENTTGQQRDQLTGMAIELQSLAQAGLFYGKDPYDRERYERIRELAAELLAMKTALPLDTVKGLFCGDYGYQTPKVDTRAAIFREGKLLLVQEADGRWALPGGWCEVTLSPVENMTICTRRAASGCARRPSALMKHATSNLRPTPKRSLPTDFVHTAA